MKTNLLNFDRLALEQYFIDEGEKKFRASQLFQWVYKRRQTDFFEMSNLSHKLQEKLNNETCLELPKIKFEQKSADGTIKWLLQLEDGNSIETVFIPEKSRGTLCVSSQVGCTLNCSFCSTATQGFNRNLTVAEIIGQIWLACQLLVNDRGLRPVTNVVFMGMGEPLLNFDNLMSAINIMTDDLAFGLAKRRVTVSTSGVVPMIDKLCQFQDVSLAISLHATEDKLRDQLVPINKKYPLETLLAACHRYLENRSRSKITFEYVMLAGINDSVSEARKLVKLVRGIPCKINLIPFNPYLGSRYKTSSSLDIDKFRDVLWSSGLTTITRKTRGEDIDAACGQLVGKIVDRTRRSRKVAETSA